MGKILAWPFQVEAMGPYVPNAFRPELQKMLDEIRKDATNTFNADGEVHNEFYVLATRSTPGYQGVGAVLRMLPVVLDKNAWTEGIDRMCRITKADAVFHVGELWYVLPEPGKPVEGRPSRHPNRIEAVQVTADSPWLKPNQQLWTADICRVGMVKPALAEWRAWNEFGLSGRLARMLPRYPATDGRPTGEG